MKKNIFGTDGIRKRFGQEPFTKEGLIALGSALGSWISRTNKRPSLLLGHDTRESYPTVKAALEQGLLAHDVTLYDAEIIPTPTAYALMRNEDMFNLGIVITASHNPYHDTGIKLIAQQAQKISPTDEEIITELFYSARKKPPIEANVGIRIPYPDAARRYQDYVASFFPHNFLAGKKIVLDCAHGATYQVAPGLFERLGAQVITINATPNGTNINNNCGSLHPESLKQAVLKEHADFGCAFDGDGDRLTLVNRHGKIKDGDDILAFLLGHPAYKDQPALVGTIMSNQGLAEYIASKNKSFIRTPVGDKYVVQKLKEENLIIGGEPSGHIILRDYLDTDDGMFAALRVAETMLLTNNNDLNSFQHYASYIKALPVALKKSLTDEPIASLIKSYEKKLPHGRIVVRYSGTEPVLRIMVEEKSNALAQEIGTALTQALAAKLSDNKE